jgi:hypothetical protein
MEGRTIRQGPSMSDNVLPLRPGMTDGRQSLPPAVLRVLSLPTGTSDEIVAEARRDHARLLQEHEPRLTSLVAKVVHERLPPVESWVGVILSSPAPDDPDVFVDIGPREQGLDAAKVWPAIHEALRQPPLADRLDVMVEAKGVVLLLSLDVEPALPVTRGQAEATNLPVELLFAKGEAFTSVRSDPVDDSQLLAALLEHKRLLDVYSAELLEDARKASHLHELQACAGVVLSLGEGGQAVAVVTRSKARRVVAQHPFLARKLDRQPRINLLMDGRTVTTLPIVVWAKGHVSVQSRDLVELD